MMNSTPFWIKHKKCCLLVCALILLFMLVLGLYSAFSVIEQLFPNAERNLSFFIAAVFSALFLFELLFLAVLAGEAPRFERIFPLFALGLGLLYLFVITPFSVPDEVTHYSAAYEVTNHLLLQDDPHVGYAGDFDFSGFTVHNNTVNGYRRLFNDFFAVSDRGETVDVDVLSTIWTLQYPVEYLPQALGLAAARLLRLNFLQSFYLGRLTNLLFYVLCLAVALRRTPRFKLMFALVGILPMALHQAASFSYDSFINGIALILTASLMKAIYEQGLLPRRDYLVLLACAMLITPAKGAYSFLILVYLLIPVGRFVSKRHKALSFILIFVACMAMLAVLLWPAAQRILGLSGTVRNTAPLREILAGGPWRLISMIAKTVFHYIRDWLHQALGVLSGLTLPLPIWLIDAMLLMLVLSVMNTSSCCPSVTMRQRILFLSVCVGVLLAFLIAMLLSWTDRNSPYIEGMQGRYLIPVLPLALASFNNRYVNLRNRIDIPIAALFSFLSCASIAYVVSYTVVH